VPTSVIIRACAPAALAGTIAIAVTIVARPLMDAIGFLPFASPWGSPCSGRSTCRRFSSSIGTRWRDSSAAAGEMASSRSD